VDTAIERDPAHQLGLDEVPGLAADLPDPLVRPAPALGRGIDHRDQELAGDVAHFVELVLEPLGRAHQLAVDVELALVPRAVTNANRPTAAPPVQVGQHALGEAVLATDAEHDRELRAPPHPPERGRCQEEEELLRLVRAGRDPERVGTVRSGRKENEEEGNLDERERHVQRHSRPPRPTSAAHAEVVAEQAARGRRQLSATPLVGRLSASSWEMPR